jgi:alkylhydroperoxidase/carboxymuconolactone decarboxylase family protein YurZ
VDNPNSQSSVAEAVARLAAVRAKRGYLLPHHGLLAVAAPDLLAGYDATYTALTLAPRYMSQHDKEFVWLAVLVATQEAIATHHIAKFRDAGGTDRTAELAFGLSGFAAGAPDYAFVADHWREHLPGFNRERAYRDSLSRLTAGAPISPALVEMTLAAVHTCRKAWTELAWHIQGAYAVGADEFQLAEALSYAMFPGSIPNFVEACRVWLELIRSGSVAASPPFRAWADVEGQGGFDEASAARKP